MGGASLSEGRIEVFINGEWGTVCDDFFSGYEGRIVCQQLNYTGILQVAPRGEFGVGRGPIWLDNVYCLGGEEAITLCMHNGFGTSNCDHAEDVGVVCGEFINLLLHLKPRLHALLIRILIRIGSVM